MQKDNCRVVQISSANNGAGDNTLVPGGQLGAGFGSIRVWQISLFSTGANSITIKSGASTIHGPILHTGNGASLTEQGTGVPWAECKPGQALVMNNTAGGVTTGQIWYTLA